MNTPALLTTMATVARSARRPVNHACHFAGECLFGLKRGGPRTGCGHVVDDHERLVCRLVVTDGDGRPKRASRCAVAAPIPRLPPVTNATLPARSSCSLIAPLCVEGIPAPVLGVRGVDEGANGGAWIS
jgi:hypothetical protein